MLTIKWSYPKMLHLRFLKDESLLPINDSEERYLKNSLKKKVLKQIHLITLKRGILSNVYLTISSSNIISL